MDKLYTWHEPPSGEPHWLAHPVSRLTNMRVWIRYCDTALELRMNREDLDRTGIAHVFTHSIRFYAENRLAEFEPELRQASEEARQKAERERNIHRVEADPVLGLSGPATREDIHAAWQRQIGACAPGSDRRRQVNSARNRAYAQLRAQGADRFRVSNPENADAEH